ncbi:VOC family protein [Bacillus canaveralius]|uniref:VOC family protein n=1 Tax=Bacillus canaveralius TaxID=1403243 RepID=UPI0035E3C8F1
MSTYSSCLSGSTFSKYQTLYELAKDVNKDKPPAIAPWFSAITLAYNAKYLEEVDEILKKAELAGAEIKKEPTRTDWGGYGGYFTDLDALLGSCIRR